MDNLELNSRTYFLWNNSLGIALGEQGADERVPVASLTKIMTALLTLEKRNLNEKVEITEEMLQGLDEFAVVGLKVGQEVSVEELIYATMLPSAGDAAQALAISTGRSIAEFAELMNQRAAEIGMKNTHFSNPVGMDDDNYSTMRDISLLLRTALAREDFAEIFETYEKFLPSLNKEVRKTFAANSLLKGGKTGFTNAAGRCLASTAEIEGTNYILVTAGAEDTGHLEDAQKVYAWVAEKYEPVRTVKAGEPLVKISVRNSPTKAQEFRAEKEAIIALENDTAADELEYVYEGATKIDRKTEIGSKLGVFEIRQGENRLYTQEIIYTEAPEFYNYGYMVLGVGISAIILAATVGGVAKKRHEKQRRQVQRGWARLWPIVGLATFILSVLINVIVFRDWLAPGEESQIYHTEMGKIDEPNHTNQAKEKEKPAPEEPTSESPGEAQGNPTVAQNTGNCTANFGNLLLINPNFTVDEDFIAARRGGLISVAQTYGIQEYNPQGNGDNLMMPEAAGHLNEMLAAYRVANPGHEMGTYSCFRARGTNCGRLCAATGTSDHHTGLTCDLIDLQYGSALNTDDYVNHREWQWLRENSYKYGFIDRFPEAWAGGSMAEPLNVDENGSTGLFETWHYRYVGVTAATEIATGKYNAGNYDSLEHYLKMTGRVRDLKGGVCE